ncbi:hypothetical protein K443DRAFT_14592 [Laccaria amethystina LaAM-08-1]|uniref:Uncharacterized protein n=1 Tax=Laccaria amethystina LaAM-08-1 TaxID=1095629 RepID=A0A0C9WML2_9AGAR|nr:hypothetical protein K443DRAFT_14592 [Laccaria amethystina LaAM-08-1]
MSEGTDHARLFASTTPGNRSASTLGSNGSQPISQGAVNPGSEVRREPIHKSSTARETRDERRARTPITSETRHGRHSRRETSGNESPRSQDECPNPDDPNGDEEPTPEAQCIEYMDDVVEDFRENKITKLKALSQMISILDFNPARTEEAKDASVEHYLRTLNEIEALTSAATKRGEHASIGL